MSGLDPLDEPRAALERGDWQLAVELLAAGGSDAGSAEGLELRAQAAYGNGDFEGAVSAWEDLHSLLVAEGDDVEAARAAAMTAMYLMMDAGLMAPVRGWLRRAERLLEGHGEAPAHAVIAMVRTYERFMCGDMDAARKQSALAIELGGRLDVAPAVLIGRSVASTAGVVSTAPSYSESPDLAISPRRKRSEPVTNCARGCAASSAGRWPARQHPATAG